MVFVFVTLYYNTLLYKHVEQKQNCNKKNNRASAPIAIDATGAPLFVTVPERIRVQRFRYRAPHLSAVSALFSLNHDLFAIDDVQTLLSLVHLLAIQVVDGQTIVSNLHSLDAVNIIRIGLRILIGIQSKT